jgi:hypothetical protein
MAYQPPPDYQQPSVYQQTPAYQPPPQVQPTPTPEIKYVTAPFFSSQIVLAIVIVGIILIFVGMMIGTSLIFQHDAKEDQIRNTYGGGRIVLEIGGLLTCIGFFGGAINNENLDVRIKVGFISAGIGFIITVMIVLILFGSWGL